MGILTCGFQIHRDPDVGSDVADEHDSNIEELGKEGNGVGVRKKSRKARTISEAVRG